MKDRATNVFAKLKWLTRSMLKRKNWLKKHSCYKSQVVFMCKAVIKVLYLGRVHTMPEKLKNATLNFYG